MKTQVSILVKNESLFSRFYSFMWFINIFKKMPVDVYIDTDDMNSQPMRLKASKTPYEIDLEPGSHYLIFVDPRANSKSAFSKVGGAFMGAVVSGAMGGSFLAGGAVGASAAGNNSISDGVAQFALNEGDVLKLSVKPTRKGAVKVKLLKDK